MYVDLAQAKKKKKLVNHRPNYKHCLAIRIRKLQPQACYCATLEEAGILAIKMSEEERV